MNNKKKRIISLVIVIALILSMLVPTVISLFV